MAKGNFRKVNESLFPVDDESRELLSKMPRGEEVLIDYTTGRSAKNHRRFFAFVRMTYDWQDVYENADIWRKILLILGGQFDAVIGKKGTVQYFPKSISWDEMDEIEFSASFNKVIDGYLKSDYGKKLSANQVDKVVGF